MSDQHHHTSDGHAPTFGLLDALEEAAVVTDQRGTIRFVNAAFQRILGWPAPDLLGEPVETVIPDRVLEEHAGRVVALFAGADAPGEPPRRLPVVTKEGSEIEVDVVVSPSVVDGDRVLIATLRPAVAPRPLEPISVLEAQLVDVLRGDAPLGETARAVLEALGSRLGFSLATLWVFDDRTARLSANTIWNARPDRFHDFVRASSGQRIAPGRDLVGRAWQLRRPIVTADLGRDPRSSRSPVAAREGVRGGLAFPIATAEHPIGVIDLFSERAGEPDEALCGALMRIGDALGERLEQRIAAEQTEAERTRLSLALDAGHMGVWEWDLRSGLVRWSEPLQNAIGREGEFIGSVNDFADLLHDEDRRRTLSAFLHAIDENHVDDLALEYRVLAADGSYRWAETRGRVVRDEDGSAVLLTGVTSDVTERKQADLRAEAERERLQFALDAGGLGTWEWDLQADEFRCSEYLANVLGREPTEPSATVFRRVHPDEQDLLAAEIAAAVEAGVRVDFTHRVILDDGSTRWIEGRGGPVRDATGEVRAITGVAGDVTLKRLSELQAEGERARLQLALAAGGMGMWEWDPGTGAAQWSDPLGGEPTESSLEAWLERVHPDDRNRVANVFKDAVRMRSEFVHEYRITDRDGAVRWIEARGRPVVAADGNLRVVGVASDVSNRKAQEARVRRKSRLLETLNEVGRAITARLDLDEVVQMVTDAGRVLTGARFAVFLHNAEDGEGGYDVSALSGLHPGQVASLGRPRRTGVFEATLREQRTVRVADITADHRFGQNAPIHGLPAGHPPVRSYLGVPVLGGDGEVFGALLFGHPAPDRFDEPSEALATGLAAQAAVAIENARLYAAAKREIGARRQALEERDRVVHELQRSLLPPNLPSGPGITFGAHFRSGSGPVGGDFYDAFPLGEVDWGIVVGDVCGKGNEAAAVTALARHTVRMAAVMAPEPERVLDLLNDALLRDDSDRFCAASFARLHVEADSVVGVLSLAGHPPARIVRRDGDVVTIPSTTGMVLGIVDEPPIGSAPVRLDPGDVLVVCTDGVTEAPGDTERFGDDRLDALLASSAGRSAQEVADAVVAAVDDFEVGAGRDDVAVLVVGVPLGDV